MSRDYYRTVEGHRYDGKMIELAEQAVAGRGDGRISLEDARLLLESVQDANRYTDTEKATMHYIRDHFRFTPAADHWFRTEIRKWAGVRSHVASGGAHVASGGAHASPSHVAVDAAPAAPADLPAAAALPEPPAPVAMSGTPAPAPRPPAAPAPPERIPPHLEQPRRPAFGMPTPPRRALRLGLVAAVLLVALAGLVLVARRPASPPSAGPGATALRESAPAATRAAPAGAPLPVPYATDTAPPAAAPPEAAPAAAAPPEAAPAAAAPPEAAPAAAAPPAAAPPPAIAGREPVPARTAEAAPSPEAPSTAPVMAASVPAAPAAPALAGGSYTVQRGDSLWRIAAQRYGDPTLWPLVYLENQERIHHPDRIRPGMEIAVPSLAAGARPLHDVDRARIAQAYLAAYEAYRATERPDAASYLAEARRLDAQVAQRHEERRVQAMR